MYAYQFSLWGELGLDCGAVFEKSLSVYFYIVLILKFGEGGDEHYVGVWGFEECCDGFLFVYYVGFEQEEGSVANCIPTLEKCLHAVGFGKSWGEDSFYLGMTVGEACEVFGVIACADYYFVNSGFNESVD